MTESLSEVGKESDVEKESLAVYSMSTTTDNGIYILRRHEAYL
jgi:hypothetical protein